MLVHFFGPHSYTNNHIPTRSTLEKRNCYMKGYVYIHIQCTMYMNNAHAYMHIGIYYQRSDISSEYIQINMPT